MTVKLDAESIIALDVVSFPIVAANAVVATRERTVNESIIAIFLIVFMFLFFNIFLFFDLYINHTLLS